jgi:PIN domain nuclease of toxin-antitoxin system
VNRSVKHVLDATAVLALILDEAGAARLQGLVPEAVASAVNVAEVLAKLVSRGMRRQEALAAFNALHLQVVGFDPLDAPLSASYVRKNVSLGDRCFLATAYTRGTGWTSDRALASIDSAVLPKVELFR